MNKQVENVSAALQDEKQKFYDINSDDFFNYVTEPIIITDSFGLIEYLNNYSASFSVKLSLNVNIFEIFPNFNECDILNDNGIIKENNQFETTFKDDGFTKKYLLVKIIKLKKKKFLFFLTDITQKKMVEKVHKDFVSNVSHELRSPLTSLIGFLEVLRSEKEIPHDMRNRFLSIMDEESKRMNRLVDDLLTLSRVEVEENNQNFVSISIIPLIQQVIDSLKIKCVQKNIRIKQVTQITDNFINRRVMGISDEIVTVFVNLIENAIKYGFEDTDINIKFSEPKINLLKIEISNSGEFISERHLSRLTERFYRIDKARSRAVGGTGLGLAIVKHILLRHKSEFDISSTIKGVNTFSVIFKTI